MGLLRAAHVRMDGAGKKAPSLIFVTHSTMIKVGTVIGYQKRFLKYLKHMTHIFNFTDIQIFSPDQQILLYQEMQI